MYINPWNTNSDSQKHWNAKINREIAICKECKKHERCTALDRQDKNICQNLRERLDGIRL